MKFLDIFRIKNHKIFYSVCMFDIVLQIIYWNRGNDFATSTILFLNTMCLSFVGGYFLSHLIYIFGDKK